MVRKFTWFIEIMGNRWGKQLFCGLTMKREDGIVVWCERESHREPWKPLGKLHFSTDRPVVIHMRFVESVKIPWFIGKLYKTKQKSRGGDEVRTPDCSPKFASASPIRSEVFSEPRKGSDWIRNPNFPRPDSELVSRQIELSIPKSELVGPVRDFN